MAVGHGRSGWVLEREPRLGSTSAWDIDADAVNDFVASMEAVRVLPNADKNQPRGSPGVLNRVCRNVLLSDDFGYGGKQRAR